MRNFGFLIFLFGSQLTFAQGAGISFDSARWKEVVRKAKEENKLIFFDAYTTWCSPCHKLQNQIFPDKILGEYFNKNFINVKFDMEKGEGLTLSRKYTVQVYPTLLFIDPRTEKVVNHAIGLKTVEQLLQLGEMAVSRTNW